jgi:hypothetical protein
MPYKDPIILKQKSLEYREKNREQLKLIAKINLPDSYISNVWLQKYNKLFIQKLSIKKFKKIF